MNTLGPTGLLSRHSGTSSIFYAFDPQGNPAEEVSSSDSILASFDFDAFGSRSISGTATDPYSVSGSQFGYYSDSETGLQLLGYRYSDPAQGRFVNRGPIGMAGGVNVYGYVGNDAGNGVDPGGLYHIIIHVHQGGEGWGEVNADPGDVAPLFPPIPGQPWWPPGPGASILDPAVPTVPGEVIAGPFPVSGHVIRHHTLLPAGTYPVIGFRPDPQFKHHRDAYGPGGVIVVEPDWGKWIHGHGLWNPQTGTINPAGRRWNTPTAGCVRAHNSDIEHLGDIIGMNPLQPGWVTVGQ